MPGYVLKVAIIDASSAEHGPCFKIKLTVSYELCVMSEHRKSYGNSPIIQFRDVLEKINLSYPFFQEIGGVSYMLIVSKEFNYVLLILFH